MSVQVLKIPLSDLPRIYLLVYIPPGSDVALSSTPAGSLRLLHSPVIITMESAHCLASGWYLG